MYSSPLTRQAAGRLGLDADQLAALIRPIPAMVVRNGRRRCHAAGSNTRRRTTACGLDRVRLEEALLELIRRRGVRVFEGAVVRSVELGIEVRGSTVSQADGAIDLASARVVVGADGPTSVVARAAGVIRATPLFRRARVDRPPAPSPSTTPSMIIGDGWYMGIAPVPGDRVNLGLVMDEAAPAAPA